MESKPELELKTHNCDVIHIIEGAGFVGTRLAKVLDESGPAYRIFDKSLTGNQYVDVSQPDTLKSLPAAGVIINLAAESNQLLQLEVQGGLQSIRPSELRLDCNSTLEDFLY